MPSSHTRRRSIVAAVVTSLSVAALLQAVGPATQADAAAPKATYGYDALGRLTSVTDAAGAVRTLSYDAVGNLLQVTAGGAASPAAASGSAAPAAPVVSSAAVTATGAATTDAAASTGTLTIRGSHLPDATSARVRVGSLFATVRSATDTALQVELPPGTAAGRTDVSVTGPGGTSTTTASVPAAAARAGATDTTGATDVDPLPALAAGPGVTAVAGRVRDSADGSGIGGVEVSIDEVSVLTRPDGRFLLAGVEPGHHELEVDGTHPTNGVDHGVYEVGVGATAGRTTGMAWTTWLTAVDTTHAVRLPARVTRELVVTNPAVPGIEVHVPAGTTLVDDDGKRVTSLSVTAIPTARQPFPGAPGMPFAWTVQPGNAVVNGPGLRVVYPNLANQPAGTGIDYVDHDADRPGFGWAVYGHGTVSADGRRIEPDATTRLHKTYQLGVSYGPLCRYLGLFCPRDGDDTTDGDPVDLQTGLFVMSHSDLGLPDVMPIALTRSYRQNDYVVRSFGIGQSDAFNSFVAPDNSGNYVVQFPDGASVPFAPRADGVTYDAVATPGGLTGATLTGDYHRNFTVRLPDGQAMVFGGYSASLIELDDRYGNATKLSRDSSGRVVRVTSPHGRWIAVTWGACGSGNSTCITGARDNSGRRVTYAYDASARLVGVTDPAGKVTRYGWADCTDSTTCTEMLSVTDAMNVKYLTNEFDGNGRVIGQTQADASTYRFTYALGADNRVTSTTVSDTRGNVRQVGFDATGYPISDTAAVGTPQEQTTTVTRDDAHRIVSSTDALGRVTTTAYDTFGSVLQLTELAGTAAAVSRTFTYEPRYQRVATATNPLGKAVTFAYDDDAGTVTVTDPLGRSAVTQEEDGEPVATTDALGNTTYSSYLDGDPVASSDPLGRTSHRYFDAAGRLLRSSDPLGNTTTARYDVMNQIVSATDALGALSSSTYDANGNVLTATDRLGHVTRYGYDRMNRVLTRTDALGAVERWTYDLSGNVATHTDRNGSVLRSRYDALDRQTFVGFGATGANAYQSSTTTTYDAGNRTTRVVDTGGTLTWTYDGLDRLTKEVGPQGTVSYLYDTADRRTRMTVPGQTPTTYTYDAGDQLTRISGANGVVSFGYDAAERRTSVRMPGTSATWTYDDAGQTTGIRYTQGTATLGNLVYTYDDAGRRTSVDGSYARVSLPALTSTSTYNAVNALTARGSSTFTYDAEGQLKSDGASIYSWNARHELSAVAGGSPASFGYDALGRRQQLTTGGATTSYLYDGSNAVQEKRGTTVSANTLTGLGTDENYVRTDGSGSKALLTDVLGSTVALVPTAGGATTTSYTYDPYGVTTSTGASSSNPAQFTGRENDGTGLYYYRARYYSPTLQRFVSQDPIGSSGSGDNLYAYVGDSPTNYTDPSGQQALPGCIVGGITSIAIGWIGSALTGQKYTWRDAAVDGVTGCIEGAVGAWMLKGISKGIDLWKAGRTAGRAAEEAGGVSKAASCLNSFTGDTPVTMADGSQKPIDEVEVGDRVVATDPVTGKTAVEPVVELIRHSGQHAMVAITLSDGSVLDSTDGHPIWNASTDRFTDAGDLRVGDEIRTDTGGLLAITGLRAYTADVTAYNLEIGTIHTYYAGTTPVLVHNSCGMLGEGGTQVTSKTLTPPGGKYRVDVENPAPGVRAGQLHLQTSDGGKYLYDFDLGQFSGIPSSLARQIGKDPAIARAIAKGRSYLGLP